MPLIPGIRLGPYEIVAPIGAGMGEGFKARDTRLERPSVSPDGKQIAFSNGADESEIAQISFADGSVHTMHSGPVDWHPAWAPSGTHFLYTAIFGTVEQIMDQEASGEGFSRSLIESSDYARWSPDGSRLAFERGGGG